MNNYKKLEAWQYAKKLALLAYEITDQYPREETYGLISQTNRAAVSIVANIAEGSSRNTSKDFSHFLDMAIGSLFELETLLEIAFDRKYFLVEKETVDDLMQSTIKIIYGLKRKVNNSLNSQPFTLNQ